MDCVATLRRKTGKKDATSDWAVARKAFAEQLIYQLADLSAGTRHSRGCMQSSFVRRGKDPRVAS